MKGTDEEIKTDQHKLRSSVFIRRACTLFVSVGRVAAMESLRTVEAVRCVSDHLRLQARIIWADFETISRCCANALRTSIARGGRTVRMLQVIKS